MTNINRRGFAPSYSLSKVLGGPIMADENIGSISGAVKALADKIDKLSALRAVLEEASTKRDFLMTKPTVFINMKIQTEGGRMVELSVDGRDGKYLGEMIALINQMLSDRAHDCIIGVEQIAADIAAD